MTITDIVIQMHNKKRYSIFIDEVFCFGLSDVDVLFYKLNIGDDISPERYNYILNEAVLTKAKADAQNFISYRMRSKKEIFDKLSDNYTEEIIEQVVDVLEKYNYVNDKQFALVFTKDKVNLKKDGRQKIKYELQTKGIPHDIIDEAWDELDINEYDLIMTLLGKKIKNKDEFDYKQRAKIFNFLVRKGFGYEDINDAINNYIT